MTDPLTYLDEVDALAVKLAAENWADCDGASVSRQGFIMADVPRLSKALRAVIELHELAEWELDRIPECGHCYEAYPCPTVRAIQAALAVNDEGEKE